MAAGRPALRLCASRFGAHLWVSAAFGSLDAQPRHMAKQPHSVFSNSHLAFIRQLYMRQMQQPLAITDAMNRKYQTTFTVEQVRRCINNRGWSARRKVMVEKLDEVEKVRDAQITKKIAEAHGRVMEDVAKGAVVGMQKAVTFLEHADNPRTLQAGATAASARASSGTGPGSSSTASPPPAPAATNTPGGAPSPTAASPTKSGRHSPCRSTWAISSTCRRSSTAASRTRLPNTASPAPPSAWASAAASSPIFQPRPKVVSPLVVKSMGRRSARGDAI